MAGFLGFVLLVSAAVAMFAGVPPHYKCLSPIFLLAGIGMINLQVSYRADGDTVSDEPLCPGGWSESSLAAFHHAKKDHTAAVNQVAVYIKSGDTKGFKGYFSGVTDSAWAQEVFHKAKEKARK